MPSLLALCILSFSSLREFQRETPQQHAEPAWWLVVQQQVLPGTFSRFKSITVPRIYRVLYSVKEAFQWRNEHGSFSCFTASGTLAKPNGEQLQTGESQPAETQFSQRLRRSTSPTESTPRSFSRNGRTSTRPSSTPRCASVVVQTSVCTSLTEPRWTNKPSVTKP